MHIVPFYIVTKVSKSSPMAVSTAHIFMTAGGTKRWETDERSLTPKEVVDMYLTPNGFKGFVIGVKGDTVYFQVDTESMDMGNFYTWAEILAKGEEVPHDIDVWRPFFWIGEASGKPGVADEYCWEGSDFWEVVRGLSSQS